jgi:hypothetical protein
MTQAKKKAKPTQARIIYQSTGKKTFNFYNSRYSDRDTVIYKSSRITFSLKYSSHEPWVKQVGWKYPSNYHSYRLGEQGPFGAKGAKARGYPRISKDRGANSRGREATLAIGIQ